ncbi:LOG family protein [Skermania piniformis]|uniref:Rossmann fold nucleotide-binding protein n=1 Tax=Skermania pinensis TaxID=39122 RepID=A0ABX8SBN9_9ACTN|nr:hypothetical protein [Skermania piniformis]QXQ14000.1 hypothetical protein KV203_00555 [Skermania piniformis]
MTDEFPVLPFRASLYAPAELFAGFDPNRVGSYADTLDFRTYRSTRIPANRDVGMLRALHDQCISEARDTLVADQDVVAIMGGHDLGRDNPAYRDVVELAARLTTAGFLVISGGGPGAMEATHLGATLAAADPADRTAAVARLARTAPWFPVRAAGLVDRKGEIDQGLLGQLHAWQAPAFRLLAELDQKFDRPRPTSVAVPTWFYGHEPPTPFASHLAKYFANALREDGLLAVANAGVIYAPGRAGTLQEIFQDAAQNFYRVFHDRFSPMVFLNTDEHWTAKYPVGELLRPLFAEDARRHADYRANVRFTAHVPSAVDFLLGRRSADQADQGSETSSGAASAPG